MEGVRGQVDSLSVALPRCDVRGEVLEEQRAPRQDIPQKRRDPSADPRGPERSLRVPGEGLEARRRDRHPEEARRDVFDLVRLVEDHGVVVRDHPRLGVLRSGCEVGEEQVMVHDEDPGLLGALLHRRDEALVEVAAATPHPGLGRAGDQGPHGRVVAQRWQVGAIPGRRLIAPSREDLERLGVVADRLRAHVELLEAPAAEVVGQPLHHRDFDLEMARDAGKLLLNDLLLEGLGAGRDHHAPARRLGDAQRRQQVGEGLAGPGRRFDEELPFPVQGPLDRLGHLQLSGPLFIAGHRAREDSARQEVVGRVHPPEIARSELKSTPGDGVPLGCRWSRSNR